MNDQSNNLITRLLHAHGASAEIRAQLHAGLPVSDKLQCQISSVASTLPWRILVAAPFPALDAALSTYISGLPAFAAQRAAATQIDFDFQVNHTSTSSGSSRYRTIIRLRETSGTMTMDMRMIRQDRTLLRVEAAPRSELMKLCTVMLTASFLTWLIRDLKGWHELEQEARSRTAEQEQHQRTTADSIIALTTSLRNRPGRPQYAANAWAFREVRERGRKPRDVYPEWEQRLRAEIGNDRFALLENPRSSFYQAIRHLKKY
jgi:hypothetical protein